MSVTPSTNQSLSTGAHGLVWVPTQFTALWYSEAGVRAVSAATERGFIPISDSEIIAQTEILTPEFLYLRYKSSAVNLGSASFPPLLDPAHTSSVRRSGC